MTAFIKKRLILRSLRFTQDRIIQNIRNIPKIAVSSSLSIIGTGRERHQSSTTLDISDFCKLTIP